MSMTQRQARLLGGLIAKARKQHGISLGNVAEHLGVHKSWVGYLEQGRYLDPAPDRLARIAELLSIEPLRIDRITQGSVADGLPGMRMYFRAKYDLTPDQIAQVERYIARMRKDAA